MKYNKKQDNHGVCFVDKNNNRVYLSYFKTEEKCIEALDSLVNCHNCTDCAYCTDCKYCINCKDCANCIKCINCTDCSFCTFCTFCIGCTYIDNENSKHNIKITKEQRETYNNNLKQANKTINDMLDI